MFKGKSGLFVFKHEIYNIARYRNFRIQLIVILWLKLLPAEQAGVSFIVDQWIIDVIGLRMCRMENMSDEEKRQSVNKKEKKNNQELDGGKLDSLPLN